MPDKGSCIVIVATDLPVSDRQLRRILKRCGAGLVRNGSFLGHGSGDVFVGFTTANRRYDTQKEVLTEKIMNEDSMDKAFRACVEATEEAVLSSLLNAHNVTGYSGKIRRSLTEYTDLI